MYQQQMTYAQPYGKKPSPYTGPVSVRAQSVPQVAEGKGSEGKASLEDRIIAVVTTVQDRPTIGDINQLIDRIKGHVEGAEDDLTDETYRQLKGQNDLGTPSPVLK
jgi:hypothetical protein